MTLELGRATEQAASIRRAAATIADELARYDTVLSRSPYLAGDALTAADLVVFPHLQSIVRAASKPAAAAFELAFLPLPPALDAWRARLEALSYYERTIPPHWR